MMIDDIRIPELGFADDAERDAGDWQAEGWVRTDNGLPQRWELRLVRRGESGNTAIEPVELDAEARATINLDPGERAVLVVMATTRHTTERAQYKLTPAAGTVSGLGNAGTGFAR
jgi:hypothetical protein